MCWEEPVNSLPIKRYEIEYITHGSAKCRWEETNRWDLPRADVTGVRIRAVDECEQKGEMFNVTLNLYSNGKIYDLHAILKIFSLLTCKTCVAYRNHDSHFMHHKMLCNTCGVTHYNIVSHMHAPEYN